MNRPRILGVSNSTRKIGRLILLRRRVIAPSIEPSRNFFSKPAGSWFVAQKKSARVAKSVCLMPKKGPERSPARWLGTVLLRSQRSQAAQAEAKKDCKNAQYNSVPCNEPDHCGGAGD